ncbi:protein FAM63A isoform X2 [Biomphalaria glabrata]|nr:protein FAM63A isoform X2 [Biomphalaria glabrata]
MFLLVTDQGFLTESNVVWETLSTVDGDCHFTDATFRTFTKQAASIEAIPDPAVPVGSPEQIDHDYQVALYLQEEASADLNPAWGGGYTQDMSTLAQYDHDLALRLQEEEDKRERAEQQRIAQAAGGGGSQPVGFVRGPPSDSQQRRGGDREERRAEKEKNCHIL